MKILVLAPQWPDPPRQGAAIRNLHVLLYLAQRHDVTLLTFTPEGGVLERSRIEGVCRAEVLPAPSRSARQRLRTLLTPRQADMAWRLHSEAMRERVRQLCEKESFDAIHVEGIEMMPYGLQARDVRNQKSEIRSQILTYDAHNAEYLLQRRAFTTDLREPKAWPKAFYSLVQWWRLREFERRASEASDHIIAVSESDRQALTSLAPGAAGRTLLLPNGVDTEYWSLSADYPKGNVSLAECSLVFDGTMDFRPNVDAAVWFAEEIWPLVYKEQPDARFYIVGRNPAPEVRALADLPSVTVTGTVDDPRAWVAGATVYVVPLRMGGGTRLKVLQAMAMERAIVSTTVGAEGITVEHPGQVLLANSPTSFARATLDLLADPARRLAMGRAAREFVKSRYAWPVVLPALDSIYPQH
jgi:sugar transferase (PEP-CTERM/EpsH1 system associated)